jgi:flagellar motility protein MotE (MotC chaperone)
MKYILSLLLIIGMFLSFVAALVAMLFFTQTLNTPEELRDFVLGKSDSTDVFTDYKVKEDKFSELAAQMEQYTADYKRLTKQAEVHQESLAQKIMMLESEKDSLQREKLQLGLTADTVNVRQNRERMEGLAKFYEKIKAQRAAEILQESSVLNDTSVATLMKMLKPQQMGKIMGFMEPTFASKITKIMQSVSIE